MYSIEIYSHGSHGVCSININLKLIYRSIDRSILLLPIALPLNCLLPRARLRYETSFAFTFILLASYTIIRIHLTTTRVLREYVLPLSRSLSRERDKACVVGGQLCARLFTNYTYHCRNFNASIINSATLQASATAPGNRIETVYSFFSTFISINFFLGVVATTQRYL